MRIVKEYDERKNEIIETAERLFIKKGYEQCSVNDILTEIGIAKGTFYHYFKSKEEVLDAVIGRTSEIIDKRVNRIVNDKKLSPENKVMQVFKSMQIEDQMPEGLLDEIHKVENALLHQKSLISTMEILTPRLTKIIEEGNEMGVFHCQYPEQYMQIFLASAITLLDDGIFSINPEKQQGILIALITLLEKMVGVEEGRFLGKIETYFM